MMKHNFYNRDVISIGDFSKDEIEQILDYTQQIKIGDVSQTIQGKILASCFFEPSTRTRLSFESAALKLGAHVIGFADAKNTSVKKGESLRDSIQVISQYADAIVLRHPYEGAARLAAETASIPVINAGDGANKHPTQTLLDLFSIRECQGRLDDLHIAFIGDLKYSRTVRSLARALSLYKIRLYFLCPEMLMMPEQICLMLKNEGIPFSFHKKLEEIISRLDVIYVTRLQKERFDEIEYKGFQEQYRINTSMLKNAKQNLKILHPLPRVQEIATDIDDTDYAYYFEQSANGLFVRQAILNLILGNSS